MPDRFFVKQGVSAQTVVLTEDETHHIVHVRRHSIGDVVTLFDGAGSEWEARIESVKDGRATLDILSGGEVSREPAFELTLACSLAKPKAMALLIQKCSELGLARLIPMETARSVIRARTITPQKISRWQQISVEASKQSGRTRLTEITPPAGFDEVLLRADNSVLPLILSTGETARPLKDVLTERADAPSAICLIGPEGGFTVEEEAQAAQSGFVSVSMGPSVLRVETACIVIAAILLYQLGSPLKT